jgi:hypothetical protein
LYPAHVCAEGPDGGLCVSTIPFEGTNCYEDIDCVEPLRCGSEPCPPRRCSWYSAYEFDPEHGICRYVCDPDETCPALGGVPYVCLEGGCHPGTFGLPCSTGLDCFANLICGDVPPDERSRSDASRICTVPCVDDADCTFEANPWIGGGGYCVPVDDPPPDANGYCRVGAQPGKPCEKNEHCVTRVCEPNERGDLECN